MGRSEFAKREGVGRASDMRKQFRAVRVLVVVILLSMLTFFDCIALVACAGSHGHQVVASASLPTLTQAATQVKQTPQPLRARCTAWGPSPGPGQYNYSISEINAPGVPKLSDEELAEIRSIQKHMTSRTLRFAVLHYQGKREFIVFDAWNGPCSDAAPGYEVLNEKGQNSYYEPGENPYVTRGGPPP